LIDLVSVAVRLFELRLVFERVARLHQIGEIDQDIVYTMRVRTIA